MFNYNDIKRRYKPKEYDRKNIFWIKAGKKENIYDHIQASRGDTEIYPTLEKYGCIDRMKLDGEAVYAEYTEMMNMRDIFELQKKGEEIWQGLPLETRKDFGNNKEEFIKHGEEYLLKKIKKEQPKEEQPKESEVNNG